MSTHYSILHISDLHKGIGLSYNTLLNSLKQELVNYENEGIAKPTFIVVSGDLIQGADSDDEIIKQYQEIASFLNDLVDTFLDNDKSRIIIVPGNHDMNRCVSKKCFDASRNAPDSDKKAFFSYSHDIRWDWKEYIFKKKIDNDLYTHRFDLFIDFYNTFYSTTSRQYNHECEETPIIYTNDEYKVTFVCFNSCFNLDHLCTIGSISENSIIAASDALIKSYNQGYLNIAVFHHHFYGAPLQSNYMDKSILDSFLYNNIHIGLYGHQHYSQVAEEYSDLLLSSEESSKKILLISSGTLFGGDNELMSGCKRQYNLIEINHCNGKAHISINVREDKNSKLGNRTPFWGIKPLLNSTNKISYNIKLRELSTSDILLNIDKKAKETNDYISACEHLKKIGLENNVVRKAFVEYLTEIKDFKYIFENLKDIRNDKEAFLKVVSAKEIGSEEAIKEVKANNFIMQSSDPQVKSIVSML